MDSTLRIAYAEDLSKLFSRIMSLIKNDKKIELHMAIAIKESTKEDGEFFVITPDGDCTKLLEAICEVEQDIDKRRKHILNN